MYQNDRKKNYIFIMIRITVRILEKYLFIIL